MLHDEKLKFILKIAKKCKTKFLIMLIITVKNQICHKWPALTVRDVQVLAIYLKRCEHDVTTISGTLDARARAFKSMQFYWKD